MSVRPGVGDVHLVRSNSPVITSEYCHVTEGWVAASMALGPQHVSLAYGVLLCYGTKAKLACAARRYPLNQLQRKGVVHALCESLLLPLGQLTRVNGCYIYKRLAFGDQ